MSHLSNFRSEGDSGTQAVDRPGAGFGLYVHIPFCHFLCHYCDFAKTANHDAILVQDYFAALKLQLRSLIDWLQAQDNQPVRFSTVFFGGGTPGMFAAEYRGLMDLIYPYLDAGAEVSLECNPANIVRANLDTWKSLGFNRISIGVQTFDDIGLRALTRDHDSACARKAMDCARTVMPNVNIDLIYGWPGQTVDSWNRDLAALVSAGVPHASLYSLTYEPRTPFGRMALRGRLDPASDESLSHLYESAREQLSSSGFVHDEVSNWTLPGYTCRHNWLYWDFRYFAAIGAGAHGFLPSRSKRGGSLDPGFRYSMPRDVHAYLRAVAATTGSGWSAARTPANDLAGYGAAEFQSILGSDWLEWPGQGRDLSTALTEYVGGSLRTRHGVDLSFAQMFSESPVGLQFEPRPALLAALDSGAAKIEQALNRRRLVFDPAEWFRETSWGVELLLSLRQP